MSFRSRRGSTFAHSSAVSGRVPGARARTFQKRASFRAWRQERECVTRDDVSPTTTCRDGSSRPLCERLPSSQPLGADVMKSLLALTLAAALAVACSKTEQQQADSAPPPSSGAQPASPQPASPPPAVTSPAPAAESAQAPAPQKSAAPAKPAPSSPATSASTAAAPSVGSARSSAEACGTTAACVSHSHCSRRHIARRIGAEQSRIEDESGRGCGQGSPGEATGDRRHHGCPARR